MIDCVQNSLLVGAPLRLNEELLRAVAGHAVDHGLFRKKADAIHQHLGVFLKAHNMKWLSKVFVVQAGAF